MSARDEALLLAMTGQIASEWLAGHVDSTRVQPGMIARQRKETLDFAYLLRHQEDRRPVRDCYSRFCLLQKGLGESRCRLADILRKPRPSKSEAEEGLKLLLRFTTRMLWHHRMGCKTFPAPSGITELLKEDR